MNHDSTIVPENRIFIFLGYTVNCNGAVVAWEFCYRLASKSVTFYPGIWRITGTSSSTTDYELVQSNSVTYDSSINTGGVDVNNPCQKVNLPTEDQFIAPAGSVVGLYSNTGELRPQLLRTNNNSSIRTYQFSGNQNGIDNSSDVMDVDYNIAIRVHLGEMLQKNTKLAICVNASSTIRI